MCSATEYDRLNRRVRSSIRCRLPPKIAYRGAGCLCSGKAAEGFLPQPPATPSMRMPKVFGFGTSNDGRLPSSSLHAFIPPHATSNFSFVSSCAPAVCRSRICGPPSLLLLVHIVVRASFVLIRTQPPRQPTFQPRISAPHSPVWPAGERAPTRPHSARSCLDCLLRLAP